MRRFFVLILTMVLLIGICGCKQKPMEDAAADSVVLDTEEKDATVGQTETEKADTPVKGEAEKEPEETKTPTSSEEKEESENTGSQSGNSTAESTPPSSPKEPVQYVPRTPGSLIFDYEDMQLTESRDSYYAPSSIPLEDMTYSLWLDLIGENYLLVAGYATGMRQSFWDESGSYTNTEFVVTDVYRGVLPNKTIKVRERYAVIQEGTVRYKERGDQRIFYLKNDMQVLIFLRPDKEGNYWLEYYQLPLMEDYRNYTAEKLGSILAFYRGDQSQYFPTNERGEWTEVHSYKDREDKTVRYTLKYWPKREVSDEAILKEMKENMLLRLATEYKIVIWPYGHKNFKVDPYMPSEFTSLCMPEA